MPYELPPDPGTARHARLIGWVSFGFAALLVILVAYLGYVGFEASRQLADAPGMTADCRTPASQGWEYEAINYDRAADEALADEPDPHACASQAEPAGAEVTGPRGVGIAGWYVPSGGGAGPRDPTVILVHGWGGNKSNQLARAELLHDDYNLVLFDLRNHGQSGVAPTTHGVREAGDLRAIVDWLTREKGPERIAVHGVSMGAATALRAAVGDERIDALIVESTHATLASAIQARMGLAGYPLSVPGSWAALLGALIRTGEDLTIADPVASITRIGGRPLLFVTGGADTAIGADDAAEMLAAAEEAGSPVELHVCRDAGHAGAPSVCPEDYRDWVLGFLERHLASPD